MNEAQGFIFDENQGFALKNWLNFPEMAFILNKT